MPILKPKNQNMEYKILTWKSANKLKDKKSVACVMQIDFNLAKIFLLKDWSFLVMPLNPFGNGLHTHKEGVLQQWIKERFFPVGDEVNKLYFENRDMVENLINHKEGLKQVLCNHFFDEGKRSPGELSAEDIDGIYDILKKRNLYQQFKLNFLVLAGDYIISQQREKTPQWGLLSLKQYLNPVISLVLITDEAKRDYFDLELRLSGKRAYPGIARYIKDIEDGPFSRLNYDLAELRTIE
jgi:hypothetical protein